VRWLWHSRPGPVTICVALFAVLALVLGCTGAYGPTRSGSVVRSRRCCCGR
jgi:hypothetical protein